MKTFLKILLAIIIVAALAFVVYLMLPEVQKMYIQGNIQYRTNDEAKEHVDQIKGAKVPNSDVTFGDGLEGLCKSTAWYYETSANGDWTVTFYGSKATMDLTTGGMDQVYTLKPLKVIFTVRGGSNVDIAIYIDGNALTGDAKTLAFEKIAKAGK